MPRNAYIKRCCAVAVVFFSTAAIQAQTLRSAPVGAWMSLDRWEAAPKDVNPDLRAAGAQIIYFEANGAFTLSVGNSL
jgi:hypothetical protein